MTTEVALRSTHTTASSAPTARAAATMPSSTRWGACTSSVLSLVLSGSPSVPFATTIGVRPRSARAPLARTASILIAVGKPGTAAAAQTRPLDLADQSARGLGAGERTEPGEMIDEASGREPAGGGGT